ncbi:hypothetical protein EXIGLDRAFT_733147 [Exidia glandulosa HHB12029]|uniref:Uncharacterized protein n=1 Tax=Exidia glandulosa HHB12029 TaxID=1314781 RepID=A0A166AZA4_EXIGL|nr:hypothetical protein EXIGLDRAFT_733147 [Exidia glandulosa HHB12029]
MYPFPSSHKQHHMKIDALTKKLSPPSRVRTVYDRGHNPRENTDVDAYARVSLEGASSPLPTNAPHVPILRAIQSLSTQTQPPAPELVPLGPHPVEERSAMAGLDTAKVVATTRAILETQSTDALKLTPRQLRALVEQELGVEHETLRKKPFRVAINDAALDFIDSMRARLGVRSFRRDFGQCDACGSWVKLSNLAGHADKRCKALAKKMDCKYWTYVTEGDDSGDDADNQEWKSDGLARIVNSTSIPGKGS